MRTPRTTHYALRIAHYALCITHCALCIILLVACSRRPSGVLSDKATASLLADMNLADAYSELQGTGPQAYMMNSQDSAKKVLRQSILMRHDVTQAQFDSTLSWYGHNLDRYDEVCDMMIEQLASKQAMLAAGKPIWEGEGDEGAEKKTTLWPTATVARTDASGHAPGLLKFRLDKPTVDKGSRMVWEFKTVNLSAPMQAYIAVEYTDGTTAWVSRSLMADGRQTVALQTDTAMTPRRLYGYLRPRQDTPLLLDSITLTAEPYSPAQYYEIYSVRTYRP